MSTLLDPRYKKNPSIFEIDEIERNESALIKEIDLYLNPDRSPPHFMTSTSTSFPDSNNPLASFLSNNILPLDFWKKNTAFPTLKKMAQKYLGPPPGSVESERTFSYLSAIYKPNRYNLSSQHAKMLLFLHFFYFIYLFIYLKKNTSKRGRPTYIEGMTM